MGLQPQGSQDGLEPRSKLLCSEPKLKQPLCFLLSRNQLIWPLFESIRDAHRRQSTSSPEPRLACCPAATPQPPGPGTSPSGPSGAQVWRVSARSYAFSKTATSIPALQDPQWYGATGQPLPVSMDMMSQAFCGRAWSRPTAAHSSRSPLRSCGCCLCSSVLSWQASPEAEEGGQSRNSGQGWGCPHCCSLESQVGIKIPASCTA